MASDRPSHLRRGSGGVAESSAQRFNGLGSAITSATPIRVGPVPEVPGFQWPLIGHHICDTGADLRDARLSGFQWPLIGHHICDAGRREGVGDRLGSRFNGLGSAITSATTKLMDRMSSLKVFQWPLIGHHICDSARARSAMTGRYSFNGLGSAITSATGPGYRSE